MANLSLFASSRYHVSRPGHGAVQPSFLSQGLLLPDLQRVRNTEVSAKKNRPEGTDPFRKCQKTEMYAVQFMNFGEEEWLPDTRIGEVQKSLIMSISATSSQFLNISRDGDLLDAGSGKH